jgi:branched-chain amino acid transport system permease protein
VTLTFLTSTAIFALLALSLNLSMGEAGLFNLGQVGFFAVGAYTTALLAVGGWPSVLPLAAAAGAGGLAGLLVGLPSLRLAGDYLAMLTLAFGEIVAVSANNWDSLTRGPMGIPGIPRPALAGLPTTTDGGFAAFAWAVLALAFAFVTVAGRSPWGRALRGVREDEVAMRALGQPVFRLKLSALVVSAAMAAVAGGLEALYVTYVAPSDFLFTETVLVLVMVVLGGLGSPIGSLLGAVVVVGAQVASALVSLPPSLTGPLELVVFSLALILLMLFRPRGVVPERHLRLGSQRPPAPEREGTA